MTKLLCNSGCFLVCVGCAMTCLFEVHCHTHCTASVCRLRLKCDSTQAETIFGLSAKRTSPFKSVGRQLSRLLAAEVCTRAVVMLDTPCSEVVWRVLATHFIRQFTLHFPARALPCAITFHLDSTWEELPLEWTWVSYV